MQQILLIILIMLGSLAGLGLLILFLWYLVRYILQFIAAHHVDGTYIYKRDDFEANGRTPLEKPLSKQENVYEFNFDNTTRHYGVNFGSKRALKYGITRIHHKGQWYSSHPHDMEKKLIFQERKEENANHAQFTNLKGKVETISVEWALEESSIRIITHFSLFKQAVLTVKDPDLQYTPNKIENLNFIVFSVEFPDGVDETTTADFNVPCVQFPRFFNDSPNRRVISYKNRKFSPASQQLIPSSGPVTLFDENLNTIVICALDQFVTHVTAIEGSDLKVAEVLCGLNGEIQRIPQSHESHYLIMFDKGINNSLFRLGDLIRSYHGTTRRSMSMDNFTTYLGYWTDNGGRYYYNPLKNSTLSETLILVDKYAEKMGIPLCNYNLDSWWYKKDVKKIVRTLLGPIGRILGGSLFGGTIEWDIDPHFMHVPLKEFKKQINKPLNCHSRWFSKDTVYKKDFTFITEGNRSICIEPEFWNMIMKQCQDYGVNNYEQDWMSTQFDSFQFLRNTVGATKKWLTTMGQAAQKYDRTIEYCMTTSGMFLSSLYPETKAVSFVRTCDDYNPQWPRAWDYKHFVQTNILAYTVRVWPFKDVFMSKKIGLLIRERQPEFMALISALSCGPVGLGDRIDEFGIENFMKTCRRDGFLIKPDKPLTATDSMFVPHAKYFLSSTYSDHADFRWWYVIQSKLTFRQPKDTLLHPRDLGIDLKEADEYVAFNYFHNHLRRFSNLRPIESYLKGQDYIYWILAPMLSDGFALIGDISKYATMSYQAFESLIWTKDELQITLKSIAGEPLHLLFYDMDVISRIEIDGEIIQKNSLKWVVDEMRHTSLIFHEFLSNTCKIVVKVK